MKLFPFILARIGGLPFDLLEQLSLQSHKELDALMAKYSSLENHKKELLQLLENSSNGIHCGFVLKNLGYLKKNLLDGKKAKLSNKLESNLEESEKPFLKKIEFKLERYNQELKTSKELENDFELFYQKEIINCRSYLQEISHEPVILNGLLMSSHSFLKQLQKYDQMDITSFAKKQFQTERAFLQYLSRICSKTSPFSTFTTLSIFNQDSDEKLNLAPKSSIRLNNHLFALWRDALNNYPPFYRKLVVSLNPSLRNIKETWTYLLNTRNVESIQKIENNELLEFICESLNEVGEEEVFENLAIKIHSEVDTDFETLENYLLELIDYGFLEWRWQFSGLDPFWNKKLKKLLESFAEDQFLMEFAAILEKIQENIAIAEISGFDIREQLQLQSFEKVKQISESLLKKTQLSEKERVVDVNQIKHFKANRFLFTPERLFYEDVRIPFEPSLDTKELAFLVAELDDLLESLNVLYFNSKQLKLQHFFLENYQKSEAVDLLSFYENYYKTESKIELEESKNAVDLRLAWQREIIKNSELTEDGVLNIGLGLLKSLSQKVKRFPVSKKQASRGTFIQLFREGNSLKGFSETSFEGNGKMLGRFLHLFPSNITDAVLNWNEKQRNGLLWVENVDASIYNPNLHPPLLPFEIRMPGSQNTLPVENQISTNELVIVYNEIENKLDLIHQSTNRKAYVFDLGFEALESRSPLYQLLATFNYPSTSQTVLTEIVNHYFDKKANQKIYFQPRICIENRLIIQRKRWFVAKDYLPLKQNGELESGYFIRINRWIKSNQIPSKVFITIKPSELEKDGREKTDNYKPQYIDFDSPVFVQLFHKLIKKVETKLKIEELLPFPSAQIKGENFATEYLIQWETK